ncbi:staygreen family protein [Clostridium magnum]|uniref:Staygreen protein n=1 Tax=Clostridium magnum DSM 2767 TaxID=1121326 RepID=A0A162RTW9_9CLOT|nr:staygreen family protein [Clostridium magnum]KZL90371.1 staygreen protein [Clostridium magnum DSM 2767]SHH83397.1 Staygreen protein [Clostridium magnum DSM 2767]
MSRLNPEKLSVEFRDGVTTTDPIIPRRYTLTHSDITAELFLTIGLTYAYDKTNAMRDEVLGEWFKAMNRYFYYVYLHVDGPGAIAIRNYIFRRELPLALEAIRYGDREFFSAHPELNYAPIIVYFISTNSEFNRVENWGTFSDYDIEGPNLS